MAVVTLTLGTEGSNIAGTNLNSLVNGAESAGIAFDNSAGATGNGWPQARVRLEIGSFAVAPSAGGQVLLRVYNAALTNLEDIHGSGDVYPLNVTATTGTKRIIFPFVRTYPWPLRFTFTNRTGQDFAASGHQVLVTPITETIS